VVEAVGQIGRATDAIAFRVARPWLAEFAGRDVPCSDLSISQDGQTRVRVRRLQDAIVFDVRSPGESLRLAGQRHIYQPPQWACTTYRAMLDGLKQLEGDLHQHIHKENNVLFPKAIRLEAERATGRRA
jgi:hypothetical protein